MRPDEDLVVSTAVRVRRADRDHRLEVQLERRRVLPERQEPLPRRERRVPLPRHHHVRLDRRPRPQVQG